MRISLRPIDLTIRLSYNKKVPGMQPHRFKHTYKNVTIYEYKIVDQDQGVFKQLDKASFEGVGLCSVICMAANKLMSSLESMSVQDVLATLRDQNKVRDACEQITKQLKARRRQYVKTHRYQFGKQQNKVKHYLDSTPNPLQIHTFLKELNSRYDRVFYLKAVSIEEQDLPQYIKGIKQLCSEQRVHVFKGDQAKDSEIVVGIFLNGENHYVSFMLRGHQFHLFNSLDEPSYRDDAITTILHQLLFVTNE